VAPLLRRHGLTSEVAPLRPAGRAEADPGAPSAGAVPGSIGLHRAVAAGREQAAAAAPRDAPDQLSLL
jgi:hypothetical protein